MSALDILWGIAAFDRTLQSCVALSLVWMHGKVAIHVGGWVFVCIIGIGICLFICIIGCLLCRPVQWIQGACGPISGKASLTNFHTIGTPPPPPTHPPTHAQSSLHCPAYNVERLYSHGMFSLCTGVHVSLGS